jgi:hypothetical protein
MGTNSLASCKVYSNLIVFKHGYSFFVMSLTDGWASKAEERRMERLIALLGIGAILTGAGCASNRAEWMTHAASTQAHLATQDLGSVEQVKLGSLRAAQILREVMAKTESEAAKDPTKVDPQVLRGFIAGSSSLADGLAAIGNSQNDDEFTIACIAMCSDLRQKAGPLIGGVLFTAASHPDDPDTREFGPAAFNSLGSLLTSIPDRCAGMEAGLQEASAEEQTAEVNHQDNVNRAMVAAGVLFAGAVALESANIAAKAERTPTQTTCSTFNSTTNCTSW